MNLRDFELQYAMGLSKSSVSSVGAIGNFVTVKEETSTAAMRSICR